MGHFKTPEAIGTGYDNSNSGLDADNVQDALDEIQALSQGIVVANITCDATVYVGAVVRADGGTVFNAIADSLANSVVLGVCIAKASATLCTVRLSGITEDVFVGLISDTEYYLSQTVAGGVTDTPVDTTTGHVILKIGSSFSGTQMALDKGDRLEVDTA